MLVISDVEDLVCQVVFSGNLYRNLRENWCLFENGDSYVLTLKVRENTAKASRVCKFWHKHFRAWIEKIVEVEAKSSWISGIGMGLNIFNYVDRDVDNQHEMAQYSVWLKNEPLLGLNFQCRPGKGKNKKGHVELVAMYSILAEYRRMHGVKKTAAKKQEKKIKKKIFGVPDEVFVHPTSRSPEESAIFAVWKLTMKEELLDWFGEQHARMIAAF